MSREVVQYAQRGLEMARTRFLYGLDKTPDDKLEWSPGGSAKNALQLAGKLAGFLTFFDHILQHQTWPERPATPPPAPSDRDAAKNAVHAAFSKVQATIAGLTEEGLAKQAAAPWGAQLTLAEWVTAVGGVVAYHQGQLNYLQLAYGDEDPNIPPEWRHPA